MSSSFSQCAILVGGLFGSCDAGCCGAVIVVVEELLLLGYCYCSWCCGCRGCCWCVHFAAIGVVVAGVGGFAVAVGVEERGFHTTQYSSARHARPAWPSSSLVASFSFRCFFSCMLVITASYISEDFTICC